MLTMLTILNKNSILNKSYILSKLKKLSTQVNPNSNIYSQSIIIYNKRQKYFTEKTNTYYVNNNREHICVNSSGKICSKCKGLGVIYDTKRTIPINNFKLCNNCLGNGYL